MGVVKEELDFYFTSFSEDGNSLSQWIAYTPLAAGAAIGINGSYLSHRDDFQLRKVLYVRERQEQLLRNILMTYRAPLTEALLDGRVDDAETLGRVLAIILHSCRLSFKDSAYDSEREWRVVSLRRASKATADGPVKYRVAGRTIVPYVQFPLGHANTDGRAELAIKDIVIGPGADADTCKRSIENLLRSKGLMIKARVSGLPFRYVR